MYICIYKLQKTQRNNEKSKKYKSETKLKLNKKIDKTVKKSNAKIFLIYNPYITTRLRTNLYTINKNGL